MLPQPAFGPRLALACVLGWAARPACAVSGFILHQSRLHPPEESWPNKTAGGAGVLAPEQRGEPGATTRQHVPLAANGTRIAGSVLLATGADSVGGSRTAAAGIFLFLSDSTEFALGAVIAAISAVVLWFYERQRVRVECLFHAARQGCMCILGSKATLMNRGKLLHLAGGSTHPEASIMDSRFGYVVRGTACVRLRTEVQVFQWVETADLGHGTKGTAMQQWSRVEHQHPRKVKSQGLHNPMPPFLALGVATTNCRKVEYGTGFVLPDGLVDQLCNFRPADDLVGPEVVTTDGRYRFLRHVDGYLYCRQGGAGWTSQEVAQAPMPGDARVRFYYVPPAPTTILALQVQDGPCEGFAPYRLVGGGLFGMNDAAERHALVSEAKKPREQLASEDQCFMGTRVCCGCNFLAGCCTGVHTPEIFRAFEGRKKLEHCLEQLQVGGFSGPVSFLLRGLALGALWLGFLMLSLKFMEPLYPLPFVHALGNFARPAICTFATAAIWALLLCAAYLPYRPLMGFMWVCIVFILPLLVGFVILAGEAEGASGASYVAMMMAAMRPRVDYPDGLSRMMPYWTAE